MKKLKTIIIALIAAMTLAGCHSNYTLFDTTYNFDRAIISLPDGTIIEGKIQSWKDYEGDQLQVKIDGITYLVHSSDIALIAE